MQQSKLKLQTYFSLFVPSSLSIVFCVFLAGLGIVLNQFETIKNVLQIPHNLELTRTFAIWADHFLRAVIGESRTETLVVGLFWAVVGLVVYLFLRGVARFIADLDDDLHVRGYVWPKGTNRYRPLQMLAEQGAFRLIAFIVLVIVVLGPLAAVLRGPVMVDFIGPNKPLQYIFWFGASLLVWHAITILLRLIALRNRLFG